jgi:hypothetical protein
MTTMLVCWRRENLTQGSRLPPASSLLPPDLGQHLREEQRDYEGRIHALDCSLCSGLAFQHALPALRSAWRTLAADLTGCWPSLPAKAGFSDARKPHPNRLIWEPSKDFQPLPRWCVAGRAGRLPTRLGLGRSRTLIDLPMHLASPP